MSDPGKSSTRTRDEALNGLKKLFNSHYDRFPPRYESVHLPEDVVIHKHLLDRAKQSRKIVHDIWINDQDSKCHKIAFASTFESERHSKLLSILSDNGLKITKADTFRTSDNYSLDVYRVEGLHENTIEELSNKLQVVKNAITEIPKLDIDIGLIAITGMVSSEHAYLYKGTYKEEDIVIKELQIDQPSFVRATFWEGMQLLSGLQHPNLVKFLGANTLMEGSLKIVTEYIPRGNLYDYLKENHETLSMLQRLKIALQICKGIEYLHEQSIIHKNINSSNILMDKDNVVKVDLPTNTYKEYAGRNITPRLTAMKPMIHDLPPKIRRWCKFTAPEAMSEGKFGDRSDVYSFGIVLWNLLTAKLPYENWDNIAPVHTAVRVIAGARPELLTDTDPKVKKLIEECLDANTFFRPHISKVRSALESLVLEMDTPTPATAPAPTPAHTVTPLTSNSNSKVALKNRYEAIADINE